MYITYISVYYTRLTCLSFEEFMCYVSLMNSYMSIYMHACKYYLYICIFVCVSVCVCVCGLTHLILPIHCS